MSHPRPISTLSFAHPYASTAQRAAVSGALIDPSSAKKSLKVNLGGANVFVLVTCLRIEIVAESTLDDLQTAATSLIGPATGDLVGRSGSEAIHHLLSVASGLDSPIVGEAEVLGQFRRAVEQGRSLGTISGPFSQLLATAIKTGRSVRSQLPATPQASLSRVASDRVAGLSTVAVLGAGAMANAVATALTENGTHVTMYARRPEAITATVDAVDHINNAAIALGEAEAVIAATSAKRNLFDEAEVRDAVANRSSPLVIIDLAMPPDFSLPASVENVSYVGLDELAALVRPTAVPLSVDEFLDHAARDAEARYVNHEAAGPVIERLLAEADRIAQDEAEKAFGRPSSEDTETLLHDLARRVARRLMHPAVAYLSGHERGGEAAPLLAEAYELSE
jgi:glutamyl-tRNA reductase